jgi:hypothetical protein
LLALCARHKATAILLNFNVETRIKYYFFQGRLNELMSQMRMQNQLGSTARPEAGYQIDPAVQQEIKKVNVN